MNQPGRCEPDLDRREAFENGLHVFALSFGVSCLVSLLLSPCLPAAIRCMGNRQIWGWSQLLLSAATFALALLPSLEGEAWEPTGNGMLDHPKGRAVAALITFTGISWSVKMTVPCKWNIFQEEKNAGCYAFMFLNFSPFFILFLCQTRSWVATTPARRLRRRC